VVKIHYFLLLSFFHTIYLPCSL